MLIGIHCQDRNVKNQIIEKFIEKRPIFLNDKEFFNSLDWNVVDAASLDALRKTLVSYIIKMEDVDKRAVHNDSVLDVFSKIFEITYDKGADFFSTNFITLNLKIIKSMTEKYGVIFYVPTENDTLEFTSTAKHILKDYEEEGGFVFSLQEGNRCPFIKIENKLDLDVVENAVSFMCELITDSGEAAEVDDSAYLDNTINDIFKNMSKEDLEFVKSQLRDELKKVGSSK